MENMGEAYMDSRKKKGCNLLNDTFDGLDQLLLPDKDPSSRELYYNIRTKFVKDKITKTTEDKDKEKIPTTEQVDVHNKTATEAKKAQEAIKVAQKAVKVAKAKARRAAEIEQADAYAEVERAEVERAKADAEAVAKVKAAKKAENKYIKLQTELVDLNIELEEINHAKTLENDPLLTPEKRTDPALKKYDCVKFNDLRIIRAISRRLSFSFEITGEFLPKHYFTWFKIAKELKIDYDIYISCVLVSSFITLIERNQERFHMEKDQYSKDKDNFSAPRLPPLTHIMDEKIKEIIKNIKKMYEEYFHKDPIIARFLVYSNNDTLTLKFEAISQIAELNKVLNNLYMNTQIIPKTNPNISIVRRALPVSVLDSTRPSMRQMVKPQIMSLGYPIAPIASGGNRRTYKVYKRRRRTQKKRNYKHNKNKKTRNKKTRKHKYN